MNALNSSAVKLTVVEVERACPAHPLLKLLSLSIMFLLLLLWTREVVEGRERRMPAGGGVDGEVMVVEVTELLLSDSGC